MKPRLLDLFCKAGGATRGYQQAGFHVVGVDLEPQPNYCGDEFYQADAFEFFDTMMHDPAGREMFRRPDAIHASPPCQDHSTVSGVDRKANGEKGTGWMLAAMIDRLASEWRRPWVVENVETAEMPADAYMVRLCGSSFGLDVRRHRWFASNVAMLVPACDHGWQTPRFRSLDSKSAKAGRLASVVGVHGHCQYAGELEIRKAAMGIDWMTSDELSQAIPPAYTEFIGGQLLAVLGADSGVEGVRL